MTPDARLSQIQTCWKEVWSAQSPEERTVMLQAKYALLERYGGAVARYLLGALRDAEQAQELSQEFAVLFLQGACGGADPEKGRFRDYLKGVLRNLVRGHFRRQRRRLTHLPEDAPEPAAPDDAPPTLDADFLQCWRAELLGRSWQALAELQEASGQPFHTVLKTRADHADADSETLAQLLTKNLGRTINAAACRKALQRAREKFAELLLAELSGSLTSPSSQDLRQELIDLELYEYCKPILDRLDEKRAESKQ